MTTSELTIASLTGIPASADNLLIACWIGAVTDPNYDFNVLQDQGTPGVSIAIGSNSGQSQIEFFGYNSGGTLLVSSFWTLPNLSFGWHSLAISLQMSSQTIQLLLDTALISPSSSFFRNTNPIDYGSSDPWIIGGASGTSGTGVNMSAFRFGVGENSGALFDLSNSSSAIKLFSLENHPISWGTNGELVTGSSPLIYLNGDNSTYPTNLGTGGNFTVTGDALTNVAGPS